MPDRYLNVGFKSYILLYVRQPQSIEQNKFARTLRILRGYCAYKFDELCLNPAYTTQVLLQVERFSDLKRCVANVRRSKDLIKSLGQRNKSLADTKTEPARLLVLMFADIGPTARR